MSEFEHVIHDEDGIIAWRRGTGGNVELTYILTKAKRDGAGTKLFQRMLDALRADPPFHTIYGFTRVSNEAAIEFYRSVGFGVNRVAGVYKDGEAMVFSRPYMDLLQFNFGTMRDYR